MKFPSPAFIRCIGILINFGLVVGAFALLLSNSSSKCSATDDNGESLDCVPPDRKACLSILKVEIIFSKGAKSSSNCPWNVSTAGLGFISLVASAIFLVLILNSCWKSVKILGFRLVLGWVTTFLLLDLIVVMIVDLNNGEVFPDDFTTSTQQVIFSRLPYNANIALVFLSFISTLALCIYESKVYKKNIRNIASNVSAGQKIKPQDKQSEESKQDTYSEAPSQVQMLGN